MKKMLIVEDDTQASTAAVNYFSDKYDCFLAKDYCEALGLLEKRRYDFVVTDTFFPQCTGTGLKDSAEKLAQEVLKVIEDTSREVSLIVKKGLNEWINNPDEATNPLGILLIRTLLELDYSEDQIVLTTNLTHHEEMFEPIHVCMCRGQKSMFSNELTVLLPSFPPYSLWPTLIEGYDDGKSKHRESFWEKAHRIIRR